MTQPVANLVIALYENEDGAEKSLNQARENNWLHEDDELISDHGVQIAPISYEHLSHTEIFDSVESFYRQFYLRAPKIASIVGEMVRSPEMMRRRLREGVEFFRFLRERRDMAA